MKGNKKRKQTSFILNLVFETLIFMIHFQMMRFVYKNEIYSNNEIYPRLLHYTIWLFVLKNISQICLSVSSVSVEWMHTSDKQGYCCLLGSSPHDKKLGDFCGDEIRVFESTGSSLLMVIETYRSLSDNEYTGFLLNYSNYSSLDSECILCVCVCCLLFSNSHSYQDVV